MQACNRAIFSIHIQSSPRYLFRVHSPGSDGLHDELGFFSQAHIHDVEIIEAIEDLKWEDTRLMVKTTSCSTVGGVGRMTF